MFETRPREAGLVEATGRGNGLLSGPKEMCRKGVLFGRKGRDREGLVYAWREKMG